MNRRPIGIEQGMQNVANMQGPQAQSPATMLWTLCSGPPSVVGFFLTFVV